MAVAIPEGVRREAECFMAECRKVSRNVRWVRPEALHLTLLFLGSVADDAMRRVGDELDRTLADVQPFTVSCRGTGTFPARGRPRVVWLGIDETADLAAMTTAVRSTVGCSLPGRDTKKEFRPHLTVGRVRSRPAEPELLRFLENEAERFFGPIPIRRVSLMESILRPEGALYRELEGVTLRDRQRAGSA